MTRPQASNFATYKVGLVQPGALSKTQLGPGWYSLSSLSNVPYVTLVGRGGTQKTFSWGELVFIPDGNLVTVKNESLHAGDIYINSGRDFCSKPHRVTVPVQTAIRAAQSTLEALTPVDVRSARRAYFSTWPTTDANGDAFAWAGSPFQSIFAVGGRRVSGSMETKNGLPNGVFGGGTGYAYQRTLPAFTEYFNLPLGWGALPGDDNTPHTLLDSARPAIIGLPFLVVPPQWTAFYTLEY